jgi:uncharacterized protein YwqG
MYTKYFLIFFCLSFIFNNPLIINGDISNNKINYHKIPILKDLNNQIKNIKIKSELKNYTNNSDLPIYLVSYKNLPNSKRFSQKFCGKVGNECDISSNFISKTKSEYLNLAIYCQNCSYSFLVDYYKNNTEKNKNHEIRLLQTTKLAETSSSTQAYGVTGVIVLIFFSLCVILIYIITIQIFVNTKLVDKPLRLGRVEN